MAGPETSGAGNLVSGKALLVVVMIASALAFGACANEKTGSGVAASETRDVAVSDVGARDARVEISGTGDVHVYASESLTASISGTGDIVYSGDPQEIDKEVSGVGEIRPE